jgi:D-serine deaminase-like pyridoxal phosphate-dependent protein
MHLSQLETPVAVVDLDRLEANIARLQNYLGEHGIANWPHIKTHKIPEIAHMQLRAGAAGICCAKVGEVEVMVQAGIQAILVPYNIVGETKLERLMQVARRASITVTADSESTVQGLSTAAQRAGITMPVMVEFDTGMKRCGVQTPQEAADLARSIAGAPALSFAGLMTFPCNENTDTFLQTTKGILAFYGITAERVSGGGTPGMFEAHSHRDLTEYRAGTYVYGDRFILGKGPYHLENCALHVLATVVSRPTAERGILDAGSKALSSDLGHELGGYGLILEYPEARIHTLSEEHGHVDFSGCARRPEIGERVTVLPNHCCVVSNLFNEIVGVRSGEVQVVWPVAARGRMQ